MRSARFLGLEVILALGVIFGCSGNSQKSEVKLPPEGGGAALDSLSISSTDLRLPVAGDSPSLAGTLTWPSEGCPCPTAILLQGAGSHDRDYTLFGKMPFALLADHLAQNGIATLRFDERGVGLSEGQPGVATLEEMAGDVLRWMDLLQGQPMVDGGRMGLVGHSEGGMVGSLVGARRSGNAFLVMLGSPGLQGVEYNLQYEASMGRAMGLDDVAIETKIDFQARVLEAVLATSSPSEKEAALRDLYRTLTPPVPEAQLERGIRRLTSERFLFNLRYDPGPVLRGMRTPVLAVLGEKDVHVPPEGNREALLSALDTESGRDRVVVLPGLNHFMQTAVTGFPDEYPEIQEVMAPSVLDLITLWISTHTGPREVGSCTVIHAADGSVSLGASNEDYDDPLTHFWVIPPIDGANGWVKFGFAGGFPQAGMNGQGLFWDATGSPYLAMPQSEATKTFFDGPLMVRVMEEAGSVEEAREIFGAFYCEDQYRSQYLLGDAAGASMIVEGDEILAKEERAQVLTNFYQSHPELGGYPCGRFATATQMLAEADSITPLLMGMALDATRQEGKYPTQYSVIYDLKKLQIYLFYYHNFHEYLLLDLEEEFQKGAGDFAIPPLFSQIRLLSPDHGANTGGSSVQLRWEGSRHSSYQLCFGTSPDVDQSCHAIQPTFVAGEVAGGLLLGGVSLFFLALGLPFRTAKGKGRLIFLGLLLMAGGAACGSDPTTPEVEGPEVTEMTHTLTGLEAGTTYYWRLRAEPVGGSGFSTETIPYTFTTGG